MSILKPWENKPVKDALTASAEIVPTTTPVPAQYNVRRSLTASGARLYLNDKKVFQLQADRRKRTNWQNDSWDYFDLVGEVKFSANTIANSISRTNLYVGFVDDTSRVPSSLESIPEVAEYSEKINSIFRLIDSGEQSTSEFLRLAALNLFIAGEFYLVKIPGNVFMGTSDRYEVRSVSEIEFNAAENVIYLKDTPDDKKEYWTPLPAGNYIARMWRKHPRFAGEADSSLKAVLDDLDDLILYSREQRSVSASRLNGGILFVPDGIDNSGNPDSDADDESDGTDAMETDLSEDLSEIFTEVVTQDGHANTFAPVILRGPETLGEKIKYIELSKNSDQMYTKNIEFKLDRILTALDIPKSVASSMSDLKYNNASVVEDSLYRNHVEPLILMICDALTTGFLHPALRANGVPEDLIQKVVIWYDPSALTTKTNKAEASDFGIENNIISHSAWRREHGFPESDKETEEQVMMKMIMNSGALPPETQALIVQQLFPTMMGKTREEALDVSEPESADALTDILQSDPSAEQPVDIQGQDTPDLIEP